MFSSGLLERGAKGPTALVGSIVPIYSLRQGSKAEQAGPCRFLEARTLMNFRIVCAYV